MTGRRIAIAAIVAAVTVFVAGVAFTLARERSYESVATVVLSPNSNEPDRVSSLLESFERSGTLGTYVELMASEDTTAQARALGVDVTVRSVPSTRAISLTAEGDEEAVVPALRSVIAATERRQSELSDLFGIQVLEKPSPPAPAGPSSSLLLLATLLLSGFAAVATVVILRRFAPSSARGGDQGSLYRADSVKLRR